MENSKLTVREKSRIIKEKSRNYTPNPRGLGYELFYSMLLNKDAIAQINAETKEIDTYKDLLLRCIRVSLHLLFMGVTKDDIIGQCTNDHFNSCVPMISGFFLGVKIASLNPSFSTNETTNLLGRIKPRIIFVSPEAVNLVEEALKKIDIKCLIVVFGPTKEFVEFGEFLQPVEDEMLFKPLPVDDIRQTAVLLFSQGRPNWPNVICLSHYSLLMQAMNIVLCCNLGKSLILSNYDGERRESGFTMTVTFGSYYRIETLQFLISCVLTGVTRIICKKFEPTFVWRLIDDHSITFLFCYTFQAIELYKVGKPEGVEGKSLKMLQTTGSSFSETNLSELRKLLPTCFISNAYGLTEISGAITMFNPTKPEDIKNQYEKPTSCGKLLCGICCKIVDPYTQKILGPNEPGELWYKTDFVKPEFQKLNLDLVFDNDEWVRSGDLAYFDEQHCFYVLNRLKDIFRCYKWHIVPSVIENVIKEHPAVKEVAVIGIPHQDSNVGNLPMAVVKLNRHMSDKVTEEDIKKFANAILLKKQQLRAGLRIVRSIPLTVEGQPDRQRLREMALSNLL